MEKKERMRIKEITVILSCLLLFTGCGENGGSEENVSTETAARRFRKKTVAWDRLTQEWNLWNCRCRQSRN